MRRPQRLLPRLPTRCLLIAAALWIAAIGAVTQSGATSEAHSDFVPARSPYKIGVGPAGADGWKIGTEINLAEAFLVWNAWTGTQKLDHDFDSPHCGSSSSCIVFANDDDRITVDGKSCTVPFTAGGNANSSAGVIATVFYETLNDTNLDMWGGSACGVGTNAYPLFIVAFNDEDTITSTFQIHIQRHEVAHALDLGDTTHKCWSTPGSPIFPLMHNVASNCDNLYPQNRTATANEKLYAKARNGW